ncbi:50S ribosomal protein L10 [candidate division WOR-3 bacterium]|nr:50S ribosomal protein L10 [candidate division WOR-3 bacterium]
MKIEAKKKFVQEFRTELEQSKGIWLTCFKGLTASDMVKLRRKTRENSLSYMVVKNSSLRFALDKTDMEPVLKYLEGPTGICLGDDPVITSRVLVEIQKELESLKINGAWFEGRLFSPTNIQGIALIPKREVLLSQLSSILVSPLSDLIFVLQDIPGRVVRALKETLNKKGEPDGKN